MTDMEKVIRGLEVCLAADLTEDENPCAPCPYFFDGMCQNTMKAGALALLREQEPRVLTVKDVKRVGADNFCAWSSEDLTILWVEGFGKSYGIAPVVAKWDEDDWNGEPNDIVRAYYFGSDLDEKFNLNEYNKTWRLWTNKPTKTQRMGAAWDA